MYLFLEYVRPQSIYESIGFLPWARFCIVFCVVAFLLEGKWPRLRSPATAPLVLYSAIVLASSALAYNPTISIQSLSLFFSWVLIYLLITNIVVTERRFLVFVLSFLLYNFKMSLHGTRSWAAIGFAFRDWGVTGAPGWFENSGEFGIEMTMFFPMSVCFIVALRRYWSKRKLALFMLLPVTSAIGMVASSSRGALLGGVAVLWWFVLRSRYKVRALLTVAVIAAAAVAIVPPQQVGRLKTAGADPTSLRRLTYWRDGVRIMNDHPVFGIGYANWGEFYRRYYDPRGQLPHNIFVQAGSELGYAGLLAFVLLIAYTFVINHRTRKLARRLPSGEFLNGMAHGLDGALIGYLVSGFFVTVLYYPYFWINLAMTVALHRAATNQCVHAVEAVVRQTASGPAGWTPRTSLGQKG